jgi:Protein of unknown function (DUF3293)
VPVGGRCNTYWWVKSSGHEPGKRRFRDKPKMSVQKSYRRNIVRVTPPGMAPIDVIPARKRDQIVSADPAAVFGTESPVWIVSGCNAYGRLSTLDDQAETTEVLYEQLDSRGWTWHPAVLMAQGREWVETGALVLGPSRDEVVSEALYLGQEAVLLWDEHGLSTISTGLADDVLDGPPVAVTISPALTGCPMRFGADAVCMRQGGPFGSRAMAVGSAWEKHRSLLVFALGCTVCSGGVVDGNGRPISLVSMFVPSRRGGWQAGPPLSSTAFDAAVSDE